MTFFMLLEKILLKPGILYAGGEHHVWVSYNDGESWESLSLNLPILKFPI